jgi:hydrogenase maturation protease
VRSPVVLIGVGNAWRSDDGVGWVVVEAARSRLGQAVDVVESGGEPARLLDAWAGRDVAVVVDAVRSGAAPGTIHVWPNENDVPTTSTSTGSHSLGIADAVALGRAVQRLPSRLIVIGIEAKDTSSGQGLSPAVAGAVDHAADEIVRLLEAVRPGSRGFHGDDVVGFLRR